MTQDIRVNCLMDRYWHPGWDGSTVSGTLIEVSTQTVNDGSGKLIPVGIVLLDDDTFQCVPMEFITKI